MGADEDREGIPRYSGEEDTGKGGKQKKSRNPVVVAKDSREDKVGAL